MGNSSFGTPQTDKMTDEMVRRMLIVEALQRHQNDEQAQRREFFRIKQLSSSELEFIKVKRMVTPRDS